MMRLEVDEAGAYSAERFTYSIIDLLDHKDQLVVNDFFQLQCTCQTS